MSARHDLEKLLGRWRQLTQAEAAAIEAAAWSGLAGIQSAKSALQKSLSGALEQFAAETGAPLPANHPLCAEAARLISLESRNASLLAGQIHRAEVKKESQSNALRNLHRLNQTYGRDPGQGR